MNLVEFIAYWPGDFSKEEIKTYTILHGEDRCDWPHTNSTGPVTIDIDRVTRVNPSTFEGCVTVDIAGGASLSLKISYEEFKDILKFFGIEIHTTFKDAL